MRIAIPPSRRRSARGEDGFTMIIAMVVMLITSLLVAAVFVSTSGDIKLTRTDTSQKQAYYAALAGISRYKYQLNAEPNSWIQCPSYSHTVPGASEEKYTAVTLPSSSWEAKGNKTCESGKQSSIVQSSGSANGTFRIEATGEAGGAKRSIIATFTHPGFLDYVYFTNYEVLDPSAQNPEPTNCEHYYKYRVEHNLTATCGEIEFASEDKVNGPLHTNDATAICGTPTFGRTTSDKIEINGKTYAAKGCSDTPDMVGTYITDGETLTPPETDSELLETAGDKFAGKTFIELKPGSPNTMKVTTYNNGVPETKPSEPFPANGVVYVENGSGGCSIKYSPFNSNYTGDEGCGNVYVKGEYTESLTIAAANDVIIDGSIQTTHASSGEPTGSATLGLIATNFVRIYHPVKTGYTTSNIAPATESPLAGTTKCATMKEVNGKVLKSTEVSEITTTGLSVGAEVEGTGIEEGTTIREIKASENKIKLSKAAKPAFKELNATITNNSTEVTGITTTALTVGEEAEGPSGQLEAGTTITEIKSGNKIKLSKAATTAEKELGAKIKSNSTEVTNITTTGLTVGQEVGETANGQLESGTTITEIKASENKIKLSNAAKKNETTKLKFYNISETVSLKFYGETVKLKFYIPTGYLYNSTLTECHEEEGAPYNEYIASENLYVVKCESGSKYTTKGFCEYEFTSTSCSSKATNLNASGDTVNHLGSLENPTIDAAILSTHHSFIVDNYLCGAHLGELTVWGSIAQFWRGPVGTGGGSSGTGYAKNYNYDERLATEQPPNFLSPTTTSWKISRETAPPNGFTG